MCNVLRKPQKEQFCQNLNIPTGQEAFEAAVVLELSESSLCLNSAYQNSIFAVCSMQFADVAFALKTQTARKNENTQFPVEKSAAE